MSNNLIKRCMEAISKSRLFSAAPTLTSRSRKSSLTFNQLEDRNLLATVTATLDAGVLTINGTNDRDVVVLFQNNNETFDLDDAGTITTFNNADVDNIIFRGRNGNDEFINNTFETSTFFGHGGNDVFFGGVGNDRAFGGGDDDQLFGGLGDDELNGGDGDDEINGEQGEDTIFGGNGNDVIRGGSGDDFLSAEAGDDVLFGGDGDDFLRGFTGDDTISGDGGEDLVFGQAGEDTIFGGDGNDRLRGNNDNDEIHGGEGDDVLIGDTGDDVFFGGNGNEIIFGWTGDDILHGEGGDDRLFDSDGNDQLFGGDGRDILRGGNGDDILRGGNDSDTLRAEGGNDTLYGGESLDRLFGGDGDDSLHGGAGEHIDEVHGEGGSDRFHQDDDDFISDRVAEDVTIRYETNFVSWTDGQVEVLDRGFQQIYDLTGSNDLLRESIHANADVTLYKFQDLPGTITSQNIVNQLTGEREIQFVDFDETSGLGQDFFQAEIVRRIGENWNSPEELAAVIQNSDAAWQSFLDISQWTEVDPQSPEFRVSGDGNWWHHESAKFVSFQGRENPFEDFVEIWSATAAQSSSNGLLDKVDWLRSTIELV